MRGIHRYLRGLTKGRPRQILAVGAAVPALMLAVAACGAAASASPAASSSPDPGSSPGSGGASAYFNCLREHGVTGFGAGRSSNGSTSSGSAPSSTTINNARKACASLRPAGFGGSSGISAAFQKFESCLSAHGVALPSPSAAGGGFRNLFSELQSNPADQAAFNACKSDLPFTPGSGGYGGGGYGGGSTGDGTGGTSDGGTSGGSGITST